MTRPADGPIKQAIRDALKAKGWVQRDLADALGLSPKHVSQVLTGRVDGSLSLIERMAAAAGITITAGAVLITGPMRTGRTLGQTPGLTTLYVEAPGDDWHEDRPVGTIESPELAAAICGAVNGWHGFMPRAVRTVGGE